MADDSASPKPDDSKRIGRRAARRARVSITLALATTLLTVLLFVGMRDPRTDFSYHPWFVWFPFLFSVLTVVFAVAALRGARKLHDAPDWRGGVRAALIVGAFLCFWSIVAPGFVEARPGARAVQCRANLRVIAHALLTYRTEHGEMPSTLQALVDTGLIKDVSLFRCPATLPHTPIDPRDVDATGDFHYALLRSGAYAGRDVPIVWDKTAHYMERYLDVVSADGYVASMPQERCVELIGSNIGLYALPPQLPVQSKYD